MKYFETIDEYEKFRDSIPSDKKIGLVLTMGNLHAGHVSLVKRSMEDNDYTVVTVFVNPKQFGPTEDFSIYPRTLQKDGDELKALEMKIQRKNKSKEVILVAPRDISEIYNEGFSTHISVSGISEKLCGRFRPGHFEGVTTVVFRLFTIAKAHRAYFGQKDYQQYKVIEKMVKDLSLPIELHMCPIVRDHDGLALSSRNQYLNPSDREKALVLPRTINAISFLIERNEWSVAEGKLKKVMDEAGRDSNWDYLEVLDAGNLDAISKDTTTLVILGAYKARGARLVDNRMVERNA